MSLEYGLRPLVPLAPIVRPQIGRSGSNAATLNGTMHVSGRAPAHMQMLDAAAARAALGLGALAPLNSVDTAQINNGSVTYAKIQNVTGSRLLGRAATSSGTVQEVAAGHGIAIDTGGAVRLAGVTAAPGNHLFYGTDGGGALAFRQVAREALASGANAGEMLFWSGSAWELRRPLYGTGWLANTWYMPAGTWDVATSELAGTWMVFAPLWVPRAQAIDRIAIEVTVAAASGSARIGAYAPNANSRPGSLLFDAGTVSITTTGIKEITLSQTLPPGLVWLVVHLQSTCTIRMALTQWAGMLIGAQSAMAVSGLPFAAAAFGPLPATAPAVSPIPTPSVPCISVRAA